VNIYEFKVAMPALAEILVQHIFMAIVKSPLALDGEPDLKPIS
jgi:hypothetical protein